MVFCGLPPKNERQMISQKLRTGSLTAAYASGGCFLAILFGQPAWFALPALLSLGIVAKSAWM